MPRREGVRVCREDDDDYDGGDYDDFFPMPMPLMPLVMPLRRHQRSVV